MKDWNTSDWLVLNNIIYKVYTTQDINMMRQNLLEQMALVLDFDAADFFLAKAGGEQGLTMPVTYNCEASSSQVWDEFDYSRGIMYSGKSMVYRETDLMPDEERMETDYYRHVYEPNNWHYSLQMILGREKTFLGVISFYRNKGRENFTYNDIFLVDMLKDHLSYRLWQTQRERRLGVDKLTVDEATRRYELTNRESTVLRCLMDGKEIEQISEELMISVNTLKKHIQNIYRKLGVGRRVQLMKMVRERD